MSIASSQPRLALSTMWASRFPSMADFAQAALEMGINQVELNYEVTAAQVEAILAVPGISISSVHLPAPHAVYNGRAAFRVPLNSADEAERQAALSFAHAGIELAANVGARTVVVHAGVVPSTSPLEDRLRHLYREGHADSTDYQATRNELAAVRAVHRPAALELTRRSLHQLAEWASRYGIALGLETRYYYCEIPNLEEAGLLLDELGEAAGYWHDVGHAENLARLGFTEHLAWLASLGKRLLGAHIHDIDGLGDHRAPGQGSLDWFQLSPHLAPARLQVLEVNRYNSADAVAQGIALLRKHGLR